MYVYNKINTKTDDGCKLATNRRESSVNSGGGHLFHSSVYKTFGTVTVLQRLKQIFVPCSIAYSLNTNNETAVVDIATHYVLSGPGIKSGSRGPRSFLYNRYQVFSGGKAAGA
jgi:hypothetical protein